jgi:hypothetical protein
VPLPSDAVPRAAVRFLAGAALLGALAVGFQQRLIDAALPLFGAWLNVVDSTYRTIDLSVVTLGGQTMVQRVATLAHPHAVGKRVAYGDASTRIESRAASGIVLQPPVFASALLLAWPWRSALELALRFAIASPLLLLVMLLDVPMILYGVAWSDEVSALDPGGFSLLATWADLMNAGGRFVLTAVAVALAVRVAAALTPGPYSGTVPVPE